MEIKRLWKVFIFLFLLIFVIFNWNQISWVFNYRTISGLLSDFSAKNEENVQRIDFNGQEQYIKEGSIEIPKLQVTAPLLFSDVSDEKEIEKLLDFGVVHFPDSVLPGKQGQTIILGHSAPVGWPKIKYDWVFSKLNELIEGDKIYVFFNNKKYEYIVRGKVFLERGEEIQEIDLTNSKNMLILISCWPPGKDIRRIAVEAVSSF